MNCALFRAPRLARFAYKKGDRVANRAVGRAVDNEARRPRNQDRCIARARSDGDDGWRLRAQRCGESPSPVLPQLNAQRHRHESSRRRLRQQQVELGKDILAGAAHGIGLGKTENDAVRRKSIRGHECRGELPAARRNEVRAQPVSIVEYGLRGVARCRRRRRETVRRRLRGRPRLARAPRRRRRA